MDASGSNGVLKGARHAGAAHGSIPYTISRTTLLAPELVQADAEHRRRAVIGDEQLGAPERAVTREPPDPELGAGRVLLAPRAERVPADEPLARLRELEDRVLGVDLVRLGPVVALVADVPDQGGAALAVVDVSSMAMPPCDELVGRPHGVVAIGTAPARPTVDVGTAVARAAMVTGEVEAVVGRMSRPPSTFDDAPARALSGPRYLRRVGRIGHRR